MYGTTRSLVFDLELPWPAEQLAPRPRARRRVGQHEFAQMGLPLTRPKDRLDALEATLQLLPRLWG